MSLLNVNKVDPATGTALELGTSGDTITVPTGAGLTVTDEVKTNKISPASGTAFTLGDSGDTFSIPSGVTLANSGTATGFDGGLVLVHSSNSSSSASSVTFDNVFTTTYDNYIISATFERDDDAGTYIRLLKSSDGTETNSNYYMTDFLLNTDDSTPTYSNSNNVSTWYIGRGSGSEAGLDTWFKLFIKNPMGSSVTYMDGVLYGYHDSHDNHTSHQLVGHQDTEAQQRGFNLVANSGNVTAYDIKIWGLINS